MSDIEEPSTMALLATEDASKQPKAVKVAKRRRTRDSGMGGMIDDVNTAIAEYKSDQEMGAILRHEFIPLSKRGAPTKYTEDMPDRVYHLLARTDIIFTKKLVAGHLGISRETFNQWQHTYSSLSDAVAQGLAVQEAYLANLMARGMKYSQSLYAVLKNLHDWKDKTEETHLVDFKEAMKRQAESAKRVVWDKDVGAKTPVIDAVVVTDTKSVSGSMIVVDQHNIVRSPMPEPIGEGEAIK